MATFRPPLQEYLSLVERIGDRPAARPPAMKTLIHISDTSEEEAMSRFWRDRTRSSDPAGPGDPGASPTASREATIDIGGPDQPTPPTWRYRMLLLAIGSSSPDGSDVTASDRDLLRRMDLRLVRYAATEGEDAAQEALTALIEVLRSEPDGPHTALH
jgi:hypothetical protein